MKKFAFLVTTITILLFLLGIIILNVYFKSPVGGNKEIVFEVKEGETFSGISGRLKENDLIKSEFFYKLYLKTNSSAELKKGTHILNTNMDLNKILTVLSSESNVKPVRVTFKEGRNMRYIVSVITENFTITEEEIFNKLKDKAYLDSLKLKYWFIDDNITNTKLYYSLEGYLYPDTYEYKGSASIEEIFGKMLDNMSKKIEIYKQDIEASTFNFHQILTFASIVELEGASEQDRMGVASVFYNRLKTKMTLGSDVTTYYAVKVDMGERDLYKTEINDLNDYNTRNANMGGKLPIGPICNPSLISIKATLKPSVSSNYYFVADKNKKVYFTKNINEHNTIINKLKSEGLWYTY
jgi:conserved hypothetical protein, YceG family